MNEKQRKELDQFNELIRNQFQYGGKKYGLNDVRESTDELFEAHGKAWLFGTMDKYCYRFHNLERERDLLKIACYCYILWLKKGFFVAPNGLTSDVLDTNISMKEQQFTKFLTVLDAWMENSIVVQLDNFNHIQKLQYVSDTLKQWSRVQWKEITLTDILGVYFCLFLTWANKYGRNTTHDEDINNERFTKQ